MPTSDFTAKLIELEYIVIHILRTIRSLFSVLKYKIELGLRQPHLQLLVKYHGSLKMHKPGPRIVCRISKQRNYKQTQRKIVYKYAEQDKIAQLH
jgi:hypothetical protein